MTSSKGNTGAIRVGGEIPYLDDTTKYYAWGMRSTNNNHEEKWSLWMGLRLHQEKGINSSIVIGDSLHTISQICKL